MDQKYKKLGIKQTIQKNWMDITVQMMISGISEKEIRAELNDYLSIQKQSGGFGERGEKTYKMAIPILSAWFDPDKNLYPFRNDALSLAKKLPSTHWLPLHWAVLSASYPFWFNVAQQTGRLLKLQKRASQAQVFRRLKEKYGDRETVARNARYTVRSFVAWKTLKDSEKRGDYEKITPVNIDNIDLAILILESSLLANPSARETVKLLLHDPAFFPFHLRTMTGDFIGQNSDRIEVINHSLDQQFLQLKKRNI